MTGQKEGSTTENLSRCRQTDTALLLYSYVALFEPVRRPKYGTKACSTCTSKYDGIVFAYVVLFVEGLGHALPLSGLRLLPTSSQPPCVVFAFQHLSNAKMWPTYNVGIGDYVGSLLRSRARATRTLGRRFL